MTVETFNQIEIANAIGMSADNFRAHLGRKGWRAIGKPGQPFTINDVMAFGLARELMLYGVEAERAFNLAVCDFAHCGDENRDPGQVYDEREHGLTFYVYSRGAPRGRCIAQGRISNAIELLLPPGCVRAENAVLIDLNALRNRLFASLSVDPRTGRRIVTDSRQADAGSKVAA